MFRRYPRRAPCDRTAASPLAARSKRLLATIALTLCVGLLLSSPALAANTEDDVVNGQSDLTLVGTYSGGAPSTTSDVTILNGAYSPFSFTLNSNTLNLGIGTLDDLDAAQTLSIQNTTGGNTSTITLNGGSDSIFGTQSADLLFVASGGTLNIGGGAGTLNLALGASGNLDIAGTATISSAISGSSGLTKTGAGLLTLSGANGYSGATTVNNGTLSLSGSLGSFLAGSYQGGALQVGGGAFSYAGSSNQSFTGLSVAAGASVVVNASNLPTPTLALNGLTRNTGGTVDFSTANGAATFVVTTTTSNTNGILGGWATQGNETTWAVAGTNGQATGISGLASAGYFTTTTGGNTAANYLSTANVDVTSSPTLGGAITVNTLRFNTAAAETLTLTGTNIISSGGILNTTNAGNHLSTITGGTLEGASGADLIVIQNNTMAGLTIASTIANNGASSTTAPALTKSGAGLLTLSGTNTYVGQTVVNAGTLSISADANLGTAPGSPVSNSIILNGGTLQFTAGVAATSTSLNVNRGISISANGGTINVSALMGDAGFSGAETNVVVIPGIISGSGNLTITGGNGSVSNGTGTASTANYYTLELVSAANGTTTNTYTGTTTVSNALLVGSTNPGFNNVLPQTTVLNVVNDGIWDFAGTPAVGSPVKLAIGGLTGDSTGFMADTNNSAAGLLTISPAAGQVYNFAGVIGNRTIGGKAGTSPNNYSVIINGPGTQIFSGANTYTGSSQTGTQVMQGTLVVANYPGGPLSVSSGANFAFEPTAVGPAALGASVLTLGGNNTIGTALGGTAGQSAIASTATAVTSGSVTLNIDGIPGQLVTTGSNNLITAGAGLTGATYTLGKIYNATDFTISGLNTPAATAVSVNATSQNALAGETWFGGLSGGANVWALSNGSTNSNWLNTTGLVATSLTPGPAATVTFSPIGATNQTSTVLGASMSVAGIATTDTAAVAVNYDGYTLTIGTGGINVGGSSGGLGIADFVALGGSQIWANNSTTNTLTVSNRISGASANTLTVAGPGTTVLSGNNTYAGTTTVTSGTLVLSGSNIGAGNTTNTPATLNVLNSVDSTTTVVSLNNSGALGPSSVNSALAPVKMNVTTGGATATFSAVILQIGARIGTDPGGNNADFSYQDVTEGTMASPTNPTNGQINLGPLVNNYAGTGFAAYNATSLSTPRIVALYTPTVGSTTLQTLQVKTQFGQGTGDHLTLGSPTANNTLELLNSIDLNGNGGTFRSFGSIRGVGIAPEGEFVGPIVNTAGPNLTVSLFGNGGLIFESSASSFKFTVAEQIVGGAVYIAANDPASATQTGALGESTAPLQIGASVSVDDSSATVYTPASAHLGFMTSGTNAGVGASPTITTSRLIAVGGSSNVVGTQENGGASGTAINYNSVVLGGITNDYTAINGNIQLNEAATTPTTFFARNGGRVDFGGVISGVGSVVIGGTSVQVEGDNTAAGISLSNNGSIVFGNTDTYQGSTTVSTGKLYVNGSTAAASAVAVSNGATLGGKGTVNGLVSVAAGGNLEAGQAGVGSLTIGNGVAGGLTFNGAATLSFPGLNPAGTTPGFVVQTALVTNGNTITTNITAPLAIGNYDLLTGPLNVTANMITLQGSLPNRAVGSIVVNPSNSHELDLDITSTSPITWTGANTGGFGANNPSAWDTATTNWTVGGSPTNYIDSPSPDSVIFADSPANASGGNASVTLNGADVHPTAVTFSNTATTYTLSGANAIAGNLTGGLSLTGTGTVIVLNANTYTGATTIGAGATLQLGNGTTGNDGSISATSGITDNGTLVFNLFSPQTSGVAITGNGTLRVTSGAVTLTNTGNTYGGGTTITGGTLQIGNAATNGSIPGTYSLASSARLYLDYLTTVAPTWANISGSGTLELNTAAGPVGSPVADWGQVSLPAGFTGTLQIDTGRVYTSTTPASLGDATAVIVGSGAQLGTFFNVSGTFTENLTIAGTGYGEATFESSLRLANAGNTTTMAGTVALSASATIGAAGTAILSNTISGGAGANLTAGTSGQTGTIVLSGTNTYAGTTTVAFGTLQFATPGSLYNGTTASWTPANIIVNSGTSLAVNIGGPSDFTPSQASTLLANLSTVNNNGLKAGSAFGFNTSNATAPVTYSTAIANSTGTGGGALNVAKTGLGTLSLTATANGYSGTTSVTNGELILNGTNTGVATMNVTNTTVGGTTILSIRNSNALGAGSVNSSLAPISMNATGTDLSTSILEIGTTIGTDPGGHNADFSYQVVAPALNNGATPTAGQIDLGSLGNSDDGVGFAAYNPSLAPRIIALYSPSTTTLATLQEKSQFGSGTGDHITMGSPTANTTAILLNPIDLNGTPQRRWASIRGVGNVPEGEFTGAIINSTGQALNISFDGNGGLIFNSNASSYPASTLQINGGAVFVAASDPAATGQSGALGEGTGGMQVGTSNTINPSGGTAVPTTAGANLAFMTYGNGNGLLNQGITPSPGESTGRNITVGGTGVVYNSVVLGTMTDDYSAMNGTIALNQAATTPTTFFARNGGRVDFGGAINGIGSVVIGGTSVYVEGDATAAGILLANNGTIVFNATESYQGSTTVSTGKLYVNGSTSALSAVSVGAGATLGGKGSVNGAVSVAGGGILEAGQAGAGALTLAGGVTFNGPATINFPGLNAPGTPGLNIGGTLALNSNTVTLNITGSIPAAGNYALIGYPGITTSQFTLGTPLPNRASGSLILNPSNANELDLDVTAVSSIVWTGNGSHFWNTTDTNWYVQTGGPTATTQYIDSPADSVIFDDSAAPNNGVVINGADVHPTSVTFNNSSSTYTVSGTNAIAGSTGLSLTGTGPGAVILTNVNTFTGATSIDAGATLQLGNGTVGNDGSIANTSGITDNGTLIYDLFSSETYSGIIGGLGTLQVNGPGTLILTNASNFGGGTTINAGTLQLGNGTSGNDGSLTGAISIATNASLVFDYFGSPTVANTITGMGSVTKIGPGTVMLNNTGSTFSGGLNINNGAVQVVAGGFGANGSNIGDLGSGIITVNSTGTLELSPGGTTNVYNTVNPVVLNGGLIFANDGIEHLTGSTLTVTAITGGTLQNQYSDKPFYIDDQIVGNGPLALTNISGADGNSVIHITNNTNTYSGTVTVNGTSGAGLQLSVDADNALASATVNVNGTASNGSTLLFTTAAPTFGGLSGNGNFAVGMGVNLTVGGNNLQSSYSGNLSGAGGITKAGTNTLILTGAAGSVTIGTLTVNNGTLTLANNNMITGTNLVVNAPGVLTQPSAAGEIFGNLNGNGTINFTGNVLFSTGGVFSGTYNGAASYDKLQAGTQIMSGANTYTGTTQISGGILSTGPTGTLANGGIASSVGESSNAAANLIIGGGTLQDASTGAAESTDRLFTVTVGGATLDASGTNPVTFAGNGVGAANAIAYSGTGPYSLTLTGTNAGANTLAPIIGDGAGGSTSLSMTGAGAWVLTNTNTYSGATTVTQGTLQIGNGSSGLANTTSGFTVGATGNLAFDQAAGTSVTPAISDSGTVAGAETTGITNTIAGAITGAGSFIQAGAGTTTLSVANGYGGGTFVNNGTLRVSGAGTLGATTGSVAVTGGTSILDLGATTQTVGAVTIAGGTIQNGTLTGTSFMSTGGTATAALAGVGAPLTLTSGTLTLGATNTYSGTTTINGGTLVVNGSLANTSGVAVNDGGTLAGIGSVSGPVSLVGVTTGATISSAGTLTLTSTLGVGGPSNVLGGGTVNVGGTTTIASGGTLRVTGTLGGAGTTTVNGTLSGTGTVSQVVTVNVSGTVAPGQTNNVPTMTASTLTLGSGSSLQGSTLLDLIANSGSTDQVAFTNGPGTVTLGGTLTVTNPNAIAFAVGQTYDLFNFNSNTESGTFTSLSLPTPGAGLAWSTSNLYTTGAISVVLSGPPPGSGTWTNTAGDYKWTTGNNWMTGQPSGAGYVATFDGTGIAATTSAVLLNGGQTVGGIVFNTNDGSYTIGTGGADGTLGLNSGTVGVPATVTVQAGSHTIAAAVQLTADGVSISTSADPTSPPAFALTISGAISGNGGITKTGTGTLRLSSSTGNTYLGTTTVSAGTLRTTADGELSSSALVVNAAVNLGGNEPNVTGLSGTSTSANLTIAANKTLTITQSGSSTYAGALTNNGTLTIAGGSVEMDGAPTLNSGSLLMVNSGTLKFNVQSGTVSVTATPSAAVTATVNSGATLELAGSTSALADPSALTSGADINPTERVEVQNSGTLQVDDGAMQQVGGIDGSGSVVVGSSTGASLTADHINQTSLVIGNGSTFTLAPSAADGSPMVAGLATLGSSSGGLVVAGSLTPSTSFVATSGSLLGVAFASSTPSVSLGGVSAASVNAVPEPSSMLLLGLGALAVGGIAMLKRRAK